MLTNTLPSFFFQMHHPIQMKPADSEKTSGKWLHLGCRVILTEGWEGAVLMSIEEDSWKYKILS